MTVILLSNIMVSEEDNPAELKQMSSLFKEQKSFDSNDLHISKKNINTEDRLSK